MIREWGGLSFKYTFYAPNTAGGGRKIKVNSLG